MIFELVIVQVSDLQCQHYAIGTHANHAIVQWQMQDFDGGGSENQKNNIQKWAHKLLLFSLRLRVEP